MWGFGAFTAVHIPAHCTHARNQPLCLKKGVSLFTVSGSAFRRNLFDRRSAHMTTLSGRSVNTGGRWTRPKRERRPRVAGPEQRSGPSRAERRRRGGHGRREGRRDGRQHFFFYRRPLPGVRATRPHDPPQPSTITRVTYKQSMITPGFGDLFWGTTGFDWSDLKFPRSNRVAERLDDRQGGRRCGPLRREARVAMGHTEPA
jgi:hypothetical protein